MSEGTFSHVPAHTCMVKSQHSFSVDHFQEFFVTIRLDWYVACIEYAVSSSLVPNDAQRTKMALMQFDDNVG